MNRCCYGHFQTLWMNRVTYIVQAYNVANTVLLVESSGGIGD